MSKKMTSEELFEKAIKQEEKGMMGPAKNYLARAIKREKEEQESK